MTTGNADLFATLCSAAQCCLLAFLWLMLSCAGILVVHVGTDLGSRRLRTAAEYTAIAAIIVGAAAVALGGVVGAWALVGTVLERSAQ